MARRPPKFVPTLNARPGARGINRARQKTFVEMYPLVEPPEREPEPEPEPDGPFVDRPIVSEKGKPSTSLTLPIREMSKRQYEEEMAVTAPSLHLGYAAFLKTRKLEAVKVALARCGSRNATKFLAALCDPANAEKDIAAIAESQSISYNDLITVWRSDKLSEAMGNLFEGLPSVATHTALDAESAMVCCPRCDGAGKMKINVEEVTSWVECVSCQGTGTVRKSGDARARQIVFEATGILKANTGINLTVNTGAASSVESVLDEMEAIPVTAEYVTDM